MIKDLLTEKDGVSYCPLRIMFIIGFALIVYFSLRDTTQFMEHAKDWMSGLGDYMGLGGGAIAGKNFTEKS